MEETKTLIEKLSSIQNELKAPKNQFNKFGNYKYRNCEDILEAVKPLCNKNRTTLIVTDEMQLIGNRYYVMGIATLKDWDSDNNIQTTAYARESETKKGMDDSQVTGSTSSYARKYALNGLFNIDDTKDADSNELKDQERKSETPKGQQAPKGSNGNTSSSVLEARENKVAYIQKFYMDHKEKFGIVLKCVLQGRKLSEIPEPEIDGLIEIIRTSPNTFGGEQDEC